MRQDQPSLRESMQVILGRDVVAEESISAADAKVIVDVMRITRMARVHRHGRPGQRYWRLVPRNREEWRQDLRIKLAP